ncbi:hypothetical protein [Deinococcus marmoris]|uniref:hypothetical protein n=1 Tax=Deinococcus marmoris TaxID=249408 RepID=UPI000AE500C9|nr:hypothetical protein [Deinococcus marmoris]
MTDAMNAPVQNPHIMFRSDPLPEAMRVKLMLLDYAPHVTDLLMQGLPITYGDQGQQVVEYPSGRRIAVKRRKVYDTDGEFERYEFDILGELTPAAR